MEYDPKIHHRRSIRLKEFDYSQPGAYFITCVTQNRLQIFGDVYNTNIRLNQFGTVLNTEWTRLPNRFPGIGIDEFIIMPNHIHGIIPLKEDNSGSNIQTILGSYKSSTSRIINALKKTPGQPVWQRNYYEHVIRNEQDLTHIREYIQTNPDNWLQDEENIKNLPI